MVILRRCLVVLGVIALLAGCGGGSAAEADGPAGALKALAKATNAQDDTAIKGMICAEKWREQYSFKSTLATLAQADPRLAQLKYRVEPGEVRELTATTATGVLAVGKPDGLPDDLSPAGEKALDSMSAPLPIGLVRGDKTLNLVKQNEKWVAC